jgi:hypothetical protein
MGKGDNPRPVDKSRYDNNFEAIFGEKKLNVWEDADDERHETGTEGPGEEAEQGD